MASKKKDCDQAEFWIQPALDGELDPQRTEALREHLRGCSACAIVYRQVQEIRERIRAGVPRLERRPFALNPGLLLLDARRRRAAEDFVVRILRRVAVAAALVSIVSGAGILASVIASPSRAANGKAMKSMAVSASKSEEDSLFGDDQTLIMAILSSPPPRQELRR